MRERERESCDDVTEGDDRSPLTREPSDSAAADIPTGDQQRKGTKPSPLAPLQLKLLLLRKKKTFPPTFPYPISRRILSSLSHKQHKSKSYNYKYYGIQRWHNLPCDDFGTILNHSLSCCYYHRRCFILAIIRKLQNGADEDKKSYGKSLLIRMIKITITVNTCSK